jgi:hypothetical protein
MTADPDFADEYAADVYAYDASVKDDLAALAYSNWRSRQPEAVTA